MRSPLCDYWRWSRLRPASRAVAASVVLLLGCETRPVETLAPRAAERPASQSQPPADPSRAMADCLARRLALVEQVARAKWNARAAIHDPQREAELLERTAQAALAAGADPAAWRAFFATQLAASRKLQEELHAQWQAADRPPWPDAPDLATELRPRLDELNHELLAAWIALVQADDRAPWRQAGAALEEELRAGGYPAEVISAAAAPLRAAGE